MKTKFMQVARYRIFIRTCFDCGSRLFYVCYFLTLIVIGLFSSVVYGLNSIEEKPSAISERHQKTLQWIRELKDSMLQSTEPYVEIAKELQAEAPVKTECRAAQDYFSLTHSCQKGEGMSTFPRVSLKNESPAAIYVFVSLSMPKPALIALNQEAVHLGATLVLRGLKDNSYQKTALYLQEVIEKTGQGFIVHPELFKRYDIHQVPSVVLTTHLIKDESVFDVVSGHIPIKTALLKIAEKGELMHEAKAWLQRGSDAD